MELYYKRLDNLTRYGESGLLDISKTSNWEDLVPIGKGRSYGTEISYSKSTQSTDIKLAYTLSWSYRTFPGVNNDLEFRYRHDRRHVINASIVHRIGENLELSANWDFGSGSPITVANGQNYFYVDDDGQKTLVLIFDEINNAELPAYHRLDFGLNIYNRYKWGTSRLSLGLYNVYNRMNPFYRDIIIENVDNANQVKYQEVTLLPVLPSFSYNVSF